MLRLIHLPDQLVDLILTIAQVATFDEVLELSLVESTIGVVQLEWPEEI